MGTLGSSSRARHGNMTSKSCIPAEFWQFNCILKSILWSYWITWIERGGWGPISSPTQRVELPICNKTSRSFITSVYTPSSHSSIQILQAPRLSKGILSSKISTPKQPRAMALWHLSMVASWPRSISANIRCPPPVERATNHRPLNGGGKTKQIVNKQRIQKESLIWLKSGCGWKSEKNLTFLKFRWGTKQSVPFTTWAMLLGRSVEVVPCPRQDTKPPTHNHFTMNFTPLRKNKTFGSCWPCRFHNPRMGGGIFQL